jgi:hypothetical protein
MLRLVGIASIIIASTLLTSVLGFAAPAGTVGTTPNFYKLHSQDLEITYTVSECTGTPFLTYQDPNQALQFIGDQIRTVGTEIGTLVTVTIIPRMDNRWTTFSVLVPKAKLGVDKKPISIETEGITTDHEFSPMPQQGQLELYNFTDLTGQAQFVPSLC